MTNAFRLLSIIQVETCLPRTPCLNRLRSLSPNPYVGPSAFVLHKQVMTLSVYSRNGELAQSAEGDWPAPQLEAACALHFATSVLSDSSIFLPPSVVLDVGLIPDRGWAVVEANASWASGIYGCDPVRVLQVLTAAFKPASNLSEADLIWVPTRG